MCSLDREVVDAQIGRFSSDWIFDLRRNWRVAFLCSARLAIERAVLARFWACPLFSACVRPLFRDVEGLVDVYPVIGERVRVAVQMAFWTLAFGTVYFWYMFRPRRPLDLTSRCS